MLNRELEDYGPETEHAREPVRASVAHILDRSPYQGLIQVSREPLRQAYAHLSQ